MTRTRTYGFTRLIAERVGEKSFTCRDVPEIPPGSLKRLMTSGYLVVVKKNYWEDCSDTYHPITYRLNTQRQHIKNLLEATE